MSGKSLLAATLLLVLPMSAMAGDRSHRGYDGYRHYDHATNRYVYENRYRQDYRYNRKRRSDNDDWAWAVGGFLLGTVIANERAKGPRETRAPETVSVPPARRRVQVCYDEVAYDRNDDPYVERRCEVDWR